MRQINQLAQVLVKIIAAVVGLKGKGSSQEALEITNQVFNEYFELDIDALLEMSSEEMIQELEEKAGVNHENLESIADLFYECAKTMSDEGHQEEKARLFYERSLMIYEHIEATGTIYSIDRNHKIQQIKRRLNL